MTKETFFLVKRKLQTIELNAYAYFIKQANHKEVIYNVTTTETLFVALLVF